MPNCVADAAAAGAPTDGTSSDAPARTTIVRPASATSRRRSTRSSASPSRIFAPSRSGDGPRHAHAVQPRPVAGAGVLEHRVGARSARARARPTGRRAPATRPARGRSSSPPRPAPASRRRAPAPAARSRRSAACHSCRSSSLPARAGGGSWGTARALASDGQRLERRVVARRRSGPLVADASTGLTRTSARDVLAAARRRPGRPAAPSLSPRQVTLHARTAVGFALESRKSLRVVGEPQPEGRRAQVGDERELLAVGRDRGVEHALARRVDVGQTKRPLFQSAGSAENAGLSVLERPAHDAEAARCRWA